MSDSDIALARRAIALLDLTDLTDDASAAGIARLCERAAEHGTAAVCVWPDFVRQSVDALSGTPVLVATVVNFPSGDDRPFAVRVLTERALADGADEIDTVLPYRPWLAGDEQRAADVIDGVREAASGVHMKVILETGALPDVASIERAARFAIDHGADFIKTSTGKIEISATPEAAKTMLRVIADDRPTRRDQAVRWHPHHRRCGALPGDRRRRSWDPTGCRLPRSGSAPAACSTRSSPHSTGACSSRPIRRATDACRVAAGGHPAQARRRSTADAGDRAVRRRSRHRRRVRRASGGVGDGDLLQRDDARRARRTHAGDDPQRRRAVVGRPRRTGGRQALDGRRGRHGEPDAGPRRRRVRRRSCR